MKSTAAILETEFSTINVQKIVKMQFKAKKYKAPVFGIETMWIIKEIYLKILFKSNLLPKNLPDQHMDVVRHSLMALTSFRICLPGKPVERVERLNDKLTKE